MKYHKWSTSHHLLNGQVVLTFASQISASQHRTINTKENFGHTPPHSFVLSKVAPSACSGHWLAAHIDEGLTAWGVVRSRNMSLVFTGVLKLVWAQRTKVPWESNSRRDESHQASWSASSLKTFNLGTSVCGLVARTSVLSELSQGGPWICGAAESGS